ncbi:cytochrome c oxidase assembly protein [Bacillus sp. S/N-304-OC-R1]|uniref:cytochrome c oxidase assembly protein n=1 Tax=Bacillus sp. S/N-304-OC-R1 TaxID=2758034 RepID=UPI001C8E200C|nr:cytochrome c oxidase assembly protein [Bacillus sp. S/N-304-OC-R1]MBY0121296.1 cytochrome c oxidase assembly protein [Bacillus sp. S/N-304-OC-R1]
MFQYLLLISNALEWNIPILMTSIFILISYILLVKQTTELTIMHKQPLLFLLSLALLVLIVGSPLAAIAHLSFSLHMIQMSILFFIIPPLLLLGIPKPIYQLLSKVILIRPFLLVKPLASLIIFAFMFFVYHLPLVLNLLSNHLGIHRMYFLLLFILAFRMWWPIISPFQKQTIYSEPKKRFAFLSGLLLLPACSVFILNALMDGTNNPFLAQFMTELCLPSHSSSHTLFPPLFNPRLDQLMAGILMLGIHKFSLNVALHLGERS